MSIVYFSSDWHLGHKNIHKFRCKKNGFPIDFKDEKDHREWLFDQVSPILTKRDTVYLLGDIAFSVETLAELKKLPGRKVLVKGNHCLIKDNKLYNSVFDQIHGITKYKKVWLTHCPIHPEELRGKVNLHGHVHYATLKDGRYFNCCIDNIYTNYNTCLMDFQSILTAISLKRIQEEIDKLKSETS